MSQVGSMIKNHEYLKCRSDIAQDIALLWSVDEIPGKEEDFDLLDNKGGYQLPIERERQLSEDFAFLAAYVKDMKRVTAVAIEEHQDRQGMTIRIAANQGSLNVVQQGLNNIAQILQRAAARVEKRVDLQPDLLREIVHFDFKRILARLRSKHAPLGSTKLGRESKIRQLNHHIQSGGRMLTISDSQYSAELQSKCQDIEKLFDQFEAMPAAKANGQYGRKVIANLLERIAGIAKTSDLASILRKSDNIDPNLVESLPLSMKKLAKYYTLSGDLIDAARNPKYHIFRNISVIPLQSENLVKTSVVKKYRSFDKILRQFPARNPQVVNKAHSRYNRLSKKNLSWNVHAEIQLLWFYQSQRDLKFPRVLSASKSTCYLCCLFIQSHGRFQVGRTHGRLYSRWSLPDLPTEIHDRSLLVVMHLFNQRLRDEIGRKLAGMLRKGAHPTESVVTLNPSWSPSSTVTALRGAQRSVTALALASFLSQNRNVSSMLPSCNSATEDVTPKCNNLVRDSDMAPVDNASDATEGIYCSPTLVRAASLSASIDKDPCVPITNEWTSFPLSGGCLGIWCCYRGLNLFLNSNGSEDLGDDDAPASVFVDRSQHWVGVKCVDNFIEAQSGYTSSWLNVACLEHSARLHYDVSAADAMPIGLDWENSTVIIRFSIGEPPRDPFPVDGSRSSYSVIQSVA